MKTLCNLFTQARTKSDLVLRVNLVTEHGRLVETNVSTWRQSVNAVLHACDTRIAYYHEGYIRYSNTSKQAYYGHPWSKCSDSCGSEGKVKRQL